MTIRFTPQPGKKISLEQQKLMMLDMMQVIHDFCEKHGLVYYLYYGTLIGAVRHKGYIPWDDDIDIVMPRRDFERFAETFNRNRPDSLKFISCVTDERYYTSIAKVYDTRTSMKENIDNSLEIGVFIDIYPIDNLTDDFDTSFMIAKKASLMFYMMSYREMKWRNERSLAKNVALMAMKPLLQLTTANKLARQINDIGLSRIDEDQSVYVGSLVFLHDGNSVVMKRSWFQPRLLVPFEDHQFYIPGGYDNLLKIMYGDYMKLPPKEQQVVHHGNTVTWK